MINDILITHHHFSLFRPASWVSWIIRFLDKTYWNHCARIVEIDGQEYIIEARSAGVIMSTWEEWIKHRNKKTFLRGKPKFTNHPESQKRALSKNGVKYDKIGLIFFHPMRLLFGKWWGGRSENGKFVCSEYLGFCEKEQFPEWAYLTTGDIVRSNKYKFVENVIDMEKYIEIKNEPSVFETGKLIDLPKSRKARHKITVVDNEKKIIRVHAIVSIHDPNDGSIIADFAPVEKIIEVTNDIIVNIYGDIIGRSKDFPNGTPVGSMGYFDYVSLLSNKTIEKNIENGLI